MTLFPSRLSCSYIDVVPIGPGHRCVKSSRGWEPRARVTYADHVRDGPYPIQVNLHLAQDPESDSLLSSNPLSIVIGMVLDQQIPLEWAFRGPKELERRLGAPLSAGTLADLDPEKLTELFARRPSLHRYPASMAKRVQALAVDVAQNYKGDAANIWKGVGSGRELLNRVKSLPGFGDQKARIFVALLAKQLGVRPPGWEEVATPYSEPGSFRSVADIVDEASLNQVREFKKSMKAAAASSS